MTSRASAASVSMPDWDARYSETASPFGDAPNEYVRRIATRSDFTAGSALCIADGDGRNGAWLAGRGLEVTAFDSSAVAVERAVARDRAAGVSVERLVADIAEWSPGGRSWQSVFLIYLQSDAETRRRALRTAVEALAPGGWFVLEAFGGSGGGVADCGPKDRAVLYDPADIESATQELDVLEALEGRVYLDEGDRHRGLGNIVRFAARMPSRCAPERGRGPVPNPTYTKGPLA